MSETPPPSDEQKKAWKEQHCWIYVNCIYGALIRLWGHQDFTIPPELENVILEGIFMELVGPPEKLKPHAYQTLTLEQLQLIANEARDRCERRFVRMGIWVFEGEEEEDKERRTH